MLQSIVAVVSKKSRLLKQQTKSVMTADLLVKATDKSVRRTIFGRFDQKAIFVFGV
jgi:hypothetical protein